MKPLFPYMGSKSPHPWILDYLPMERHYLEACCGSAAILLARPRPRGIETINDLDHSVFALLTAIRDHPQEFQRRIALTEWSRHLHAHCRELIHDPGLPLLDRAWCYWVLVTQSRNGMPYHGGWSYSTNQTRRGLPNPLAKAHTRVGLIPWYALRLRTVQIECLHVLEVIDKYERPDMLIYCDPDYHPSSRSGSRYLHQLTRSEHENLSDRLHRCECKVAISGYRCRDYDRLYADFWRVNGPPRPTNASDQRNLRQEILWCNYDPRKIRQGDHSQAR